MKDAIVDVVIPVYRPDEKFKKLMSSLNRQSHKPRTILLMNTEKEAFPKAGYETWEHVRIEHLTKAEFDHGGTRNRAAALLDGDFILFMTQDAVPEDDRLIEHLLEAFDDGQVAAAYARQLPAKDCDMLERYTRSFNYPKESRVKSEKDLSTLGIKTFFCSNVCAMYRRSIYETMEGFTTHTIFNEDMIFAGGLIKAGYKVAYQAQAKVIHSHNYSGMQQLHRNFDLAVSQADHPEIFGMVSSESEGIRMVKSTAAYLVHIGKPWLIVSLVWRSGCKYIGYKLGKSYRKLPKQLILQLTSQKSYWK